MIQSSIQRRTSPLAMIASYFWYGVRRYVTYHHMTAKEASCGEQKVGIREQQCRRQKIREEVIHKDHWRSLTLEEARLKTFSKWLVKSQECWFMHWHCAAMAITMAAQWLQWSKKPPRQPF